MVTLYLGVQAWLQRDLQQGVLPSLSGELIDGSVFDSRSLVGESWLLYVWAEWCPMCQLQRPAINTVQQHWPVVTLAMQSGSPAAVADYLQAHQLHWTTIVDEEAALATRLGVTAVPTLFVIDAAGNIRFSERGYTTAIGLRLRLWWSRWYHR